MDNFFLNDIAAEAGPLLTGRPASRISGSGPAILFDMGPRRVLIVRLDQSNPGFYIGEEPSRKTAKGSGRGGGGQVPFVLLLKSRLTGFRLAEMRKPADDRTVTMFFHGQAADSPATEAQVYRLELHFTGRSTNAFLFNSEGHMEGAFRDRGGETSVSSEIGQIGEARVTGCFATDFISIAKAEIAKTNFSQEEIIDRYFRGGSPLGPGLRREFLRRAGSAESAGAFTSLLDDLVERPHRPLVYSTFPLDQAGERLANSSKDVALSCIPLSLGGEMVEREFETFSAAAAAYYAAIDNIEQFNARYSNAVRLLATAVKKEQGLLASVHEDISRFSDPDRFKRNGDLLLAGLATAKRTPHGAMVTDLYDEAQTEIEIGLEEGESLQEAAARYYGLYQKGRRALKVLEPRARAIAEKVDRLEALAESIETDPTAGNLAHIEKRLGIAKPDHPALGPGRARKKDKTRTPAIGRRFISSDGYEIVVGKNDRENDTITFRVAGSHDVWLHAADYPGSHVVVRNPKRQPVPFKTIVEAAEVAAQYSQAKKEKKAAVHYAQKKFVTKPPKSKPGLVRLSSFKTVMVEPGIKVKKVEEPGQRIELSSEP